jgi:hypothetical protein
VTDIRHNIAWSNLALWQVDECNPDSKSFLHIRISKYLGKTFVGTHSGFTIRASRFYFKALLRSSFAAGMQ